MNDIEKLKYDLAMHAAMAKTVLDYQNVTEMAAVQNKFLTNFEMIYRKYSEDEYFSKKINELIIRFATRTNY